MSVPSILPAFRHILLALMFVPVSTFSHAKAPEPPQRLALQAMGFQPPGAGAMATSGNSITVHFIDDQHLLVTFAVRRLMKRLPDDPPDDQDRTIEAVVVHLPSGKVLARTSWRLHDNAQYLWNLGHGRFLLRMRDTLTTFVPLENLEHEEAFVEQPFLASSRRLAAIILSPDRDLITVETIEKPAVTAGDSSATVLNSPDSGRAQLNFYRIVEPVQPVDRVIVQSAGVATAAGLVNLSITSAGYIEVLKESATRWLFDFDPYVGKYVELSPVDSSCRPRPVFVSASEFVAFGCRGGDDKLMLGGFNMRGEQMWQQNFTETHAFPNFALAPKAGRFALSRNLVASGSGITADFAPSAFTTQEIRVYQTYNGKQLLQLQTTPVQRAGQNYDLSPDGLRLAVIRDRAVEIYHLPPLVGADEAAIRAAKALEPADVSASVNLMSHAKGPAAGKTVATEPAASVPPPPTFAAPQPTAAAPIVNGDEPATERRKPPTLYTLPTDKPEERPH
ncbi:hypothetical protein [Granulicella arctica]|uniref:hypothetical protein n=1 Tax=Granulicella arctica TaxID=940613 RepID=UPI0021DF55B3|nr:hypothetical protein [Granulicella arctica]